MLKPIDYNIARIFNFAKDVQDHLQDTGIPLKRVAYEYHYDNTPYLEITLADFMDKRRKIIPQYLGLNDGDYSLYCNIVHIGDRHLLEVFNRIYGINAISILVDDNCDYLLYL